MNQKTLRALNAINLAFYRDAAAEFSATRSNPWPGWQRIVAALEGRERPLRVLDVGCGNARFAEFLATRGLAPARYVGVDASEALLEHARRRLGALASREPVRPRGAGAVELRLGDLASDPLGALLPRERFGLIALFGVLHHVPSFARRRALLQALAERLERGGILALAQWQFANAERFRKKAVPWHEFNRSAAEAIDVEQLEPGDELLRWGRGQGQLRYCHFASEEELGELLSGLELDCIERYVADGRSHDLNRYVLLRAPGA